MAGRNAQGPHQIDNRRSVMLCMLLGDRANWWLLTPNSGNSSNAANVNNNGNANNNNASNTGIGAPV